MHVFEVVRFCSFCGKPFEEGNGIRSFFADEDGKDVGGVLHTNHYGVSVHEACAETIAEMMHDEAMMDA